MNVQTSLQRPAVNIQNTRVRRDRRIGLVFIHLAVISLKSPRNLSIRTFFRYLLCNRPEILIQVKDNSIIIFYIKFSIAVRSHTLQCTSSDTLSCFFQISDSLNLGKRQEAAATISNLYKYYRDKEEELGLKEEKKEYEYWLTKICLLALVLISSSIGYILYSKNRHLKKVVNLMKILEKANLDRETLTSVIQQKNIELKDAETIINKTSCELIEKQKALSSLNCELEQITSELNVKEQLLSIKIEQNKSFVRLLHQAELENTAEDVIVTMKRSATGRKSLSPNDWNQFYKAVDEIYPDFKSLISQKIDRVTDEQIKFCYLMRAGFTKNQIQNITGLSRVTAWRWEKKYEWVYEKP